MHWPSTLTHPYNKVTVEIIHFYHKLWQKKVILPQLMQQGFGRLQNLLYICINDFSKYLGSTSMRLPLIASTLLLALLTSCASQYNIAGNSSLAGLDGQKLYLRYTNFNERRTHIVNLDSCEVVHGHFNFGGRMDSIALAEVYMGNDLLMPIVLEGGEIFMQLDNYGPLVEGGPLNEKLTVFLKDRLNYENQIWELDCKVRRRVYDGEPLDMVMNSVAGKRKALLRKIEDLEVKFVLDNSNNPLGPGYFMQMAHQLGIPTLTDQFRRILDQAPPPFFRHPQVRSYLAAAGYSPDASRHRHAMKKKDKKQ